MKRWISLFIAFVVLSAPALAQAMPLRPMQTVPGATGNDVSWPNCRESNAASGQFGIVGVNGGKVFTDNKCLRQEVGWFPNSTLALYANTANWGLPRGKAYTNFPFKCKANDELCVSYDFGYSTGKYTVMYAASQGAHSENWWLDVEAVNSWTGNLAANRQALQGIADAIRHYTVFGTIGFYSTSLQWSQIVGDWQPDDAAWLAIGPGTAEEAAPYCKAPSFTAGEILLVQYTQKLDRDVVC